MVYEGLFLAFQGVAYVQRVAAIALLFCCASCGGGGSTSVVSPSTPNPITSQTISATISNQPISLPSVGGYASSITFPVTDAENQAVSITVSTAAIASSALSTVRQAAASASGPLLYIYITPHAALNLSGFPALNVTPPSIAANTNYFLAFGDPAVSGVNLVPFYRGPASISGTTLSFPAGTTSITFAPNTTYTLALSGVPLPSSPLSVSSAQVELTAIGQATDLRIDEPQYNGGFTVYVADPNVVKATVSGNSLHLVAKSAGKSRVVLHDSYGQEADVDVAVTLADVVIHTKR